MREINLDNKLVNDSTSPYIIAEIGHNHQGKLDIAMEMFRVAKDCGANCVKLQKRNNKSLFTKELYESCYDGKASYGKTYGAHREALEFGREEYLRLKEYADEIGISYIRSIDSAFLDTPRSNLSSEVSDILGDEKFIVFVPNELCWHPTFVNCDADHLMNIYSGILEMLLEEYKGSNVVMLPQLFNIGRLGDEHYFHKLKNKVNNNRIIVMPEKYGSDIQQTIISRASLLMMSSSTPNHWSKRRSLYEILRPGCHPVLNPQLKQWYDIPPSDPFMIPPRCLLSTE